MLTRVRPPRESAPEAAADHHAFAYAADAQYPRPVPNVLEFNAPAHENWNIVHTGMLVPQSHQVYVCARNCLRGVVLTAAEMGASQRFSSVVVDEKDLYDNLESVTIEGVSDVIRRLPQQPRVVMLFLVCLHHFVGTDVGYVYRQLQERFPNVCFMRCWMDPIMQKTGPTPEMKERSAMLDPVEPQPVDPRLVGVVGDDLRLPDDSDIARMLRGAGWRLLQVHDMRTFDEYLGYGRCAAFVTRSPFSERGMRGLAKRLGRPAVYLPVSMDPDQIELGLDQLADALGIERPDVSGRRHECERQLDQLAQELRGVPVALDYMAVNLPLQLARLLLQHGVDVRRVYLDVVAPQDREALEWLRANAPRLELWSTVHPTLRQAPRDDGDGWLAVGPKAAWFLGTSHFVNVIECDGMWGYQCVEGLCGLMREAWSTSKDPRQLVPRKGLGWPCACQLPR
ncbi:MAG: nitrogenase component 1 [Atopobiaceae bacterium]